MKTTKKQNNQPKKEKTVSTKTPFTLYWEKMGDKRGKIYDMKAVMK